MSITFDNPLAAAADNLAVAANDSGPTASESMRVDMKANNSVDEPTEQSVLADIADASWSFDRLGPQPDPEAARLAEPTEMTVNLEENEQSENGEDALITTTGDPTPATEQDIEELPENQDNNRDGNQAGNQDGQAAHVPNTDHFVWVDRGDAVDESPDCKLCMTRPGPDDDPLYVECGHVWCKNCLNQYFAQTFTNRDQFPPRCCRPEGFNLDVIGMYLDDEVLMHVWEKWEEWNASDPTYCSNAQCNEFVPVDRVEGQWAVCFKCRVKTCVECKAKEAAHPTLGQHPEPEKDDEENRKLAETEGWKYCPNNKCNKLVEKIDGCDTMTCKCGQQFCYRCGNSFEDPFPCTCNEMERGGEDSDDDEDEDEDEVEEDAEERTTTEG